jgi:hypothetical protein
MSRRRRSVQDAVRVIIARDPYLYRGIRMQVINYSAVARYIHDEVKTLAGNEVDPNTIVTAIMRFSKEARQQKNRERSHSLKGCRLNLVTDVKDIMIEASARDQVEIIEKLLELQKRGLRLKFHQFPNSIKILATSESINDIMQSLWQYEPVVNEGFAELNISIIGGDEKMDRIALLTDLLFRNGIHIRDAFFSSNEMNLIISEEDASKAFEILRVQTR